MLDWIRDYRSEWLKADIVAGLTAAAVVIPQAMAYATIAGLPIQIGLYTALVPTVIYAVLGTSRPLSVSTTSTIAILTAAALGRVAPGGAPVDLAGAATTLAFLVGVTLVLAGILHLGFVANFISEPVLIGFKAGIGLVIVLDQIPKLLGISFHKGAFFHNVLATAQGLPHLSPSTLAVGVVTLAVLLGVERFVPRGPAPLLAIAVGIAGMSVLGLQAYGVGTVGHVPTGLPSLALPDSALIRGLWPAALGIALMSFTETIACGRAFAASHEPNPAPNRELVALGLANAGGAFLGSMPAGGGTSQTAVNRLAGARTQLAELVMAGVTLVTMLLLARFIERIPEPTLAAVVLVSSAGLIKPAEFRKVHRVREMEFLWAVAALVGVVLLGTLEGILVAIIVSFVAVAHQMAAPPIYVLGRKPGTNVFRPRSAEHPEDETFPGLLLLRPEGQIFFVNAEHVAAKMRTLIAEAKAKVVALDFGGVSDLEYTALKMVTQAEEMQRESGVMLWLVDLDPGVLAMVQRSPLGETLGRERMLFNLEQAVAKYQASQAQTAPQRTHPEPRSP
jgi:high affinity sulfate transporter 1